MTFGEAGQTLPLALLFSTVFLLGGRLHSPVNILRHNAVSLGAGASVAYIFIQLLPELDSANTIFRSSTSHLALPYHGRYGLHLATMIGFLFFYGLDQMVSAKRAANGERDAGEFFWVQLVAFGSNTWIVGYLLVRSLDNGESSLLAYSVAMGLHFLICAHSLQEEHGAAYDRIGRWLLAACVMGGWISGLLLNLPQAVVVILFGLVAGGVLVNTMIMELPRNQPGKFVPFLIGAASYAALLAGLN